MMDQPLVPLNAMLLLAQAKRDTVVGPARCNVWVDSDQRRGWDLIRSNFILSDPMLYVKKSIFRPCG
jgi:hypothetical protein